MVVFEEFLAGIFSHNKDLYKYLKLFFQTNVLYCSYTVVITPGGAHTAFIVDIPPPNI